MGTTDFDFDFAGEAVLVTGRSSGIGRVLAPSWSRRT
jgi:NAD(P)-dependent dehydrogenase (short-subunit alcohol dehydrogenase family)